MLELAKEAVASGSPAAKELDEIASPHGEDDLNNRLRAGILDLRSLAADLKEDDKKQKAQSIDQRLAAASAKGENSPRGPEVTPR
eukprot:scaffold81448_cov42-Phaeocystis_antarctica.AAC.1